MPDNLHPSDDRQAIPVDGNKARNIDRRFCVAPMLDLTDRHCRVFLRQLSQQAVLYTEMITTGALIHGKGGPARFLDYDESEHPIALQLGGSDPTALAHCAKLASQWGYDELNLNCGCPSDRVQNGMFGACLMAKPELVADGIKAMQDVSDIDITVKHRIGIDDMESYQELLDFLQPLIDCGCQSFIVHARKAWLQGLSPKQNREIPPLDYEMVYQLKRDLPDLEIIINGGIKTIAECQQHLRHVDGVMVGREAYYNSSLMLDVDREIYGDRSERTRPESAIRAMYPYIEAQLSTNNVRLNHITRHMLGLFQGVKGAKMFRRYLSENAHKTGAGTEVLEQALAALEL
ncbi:tRNA-U16,U17-dihydrouridine synthase [Sinobacterium caligoides]|uniref:tRNA-dihydrouridine(20/20a) synthase n=1 Tax=Sinobacterium caligoides TaxID=933926 RepID=A0A3N2DY59_9GAMM|nr:tRNA dihydrouridine(20/20a) synthase DusA [Sinobacterium caligoides]ROS04806.1 tRNA-U16,U17-dihydrouridine synthase [Sinobacterium caligoides]